MNDDRIKNEILRSFKQECDNISKIDAPDYQTSAEFQTGMSKILGKAAKKPKRDELANAQLHRDQVNKKKSSRKEVVVLKPQYFRPDSPKSGTPFKKVMIAVAAVVCVVAAGIFIRVKNKPETISPDNSVSKSDTSISNSDTNNSDVKLNQNITSAKCYKVDFQTVTEDQVAALFKNAPQRETNEFGTTHFTSDGEKGSLGQSPGVGGKGTYYAVLYSTEQGDKYDTAAYRNFAEVAENKDWSFMSAADAEKKISEIMTSFMTTGVNVKAYAISADTYSELVKKKVEADREWNKKLQEELGITSEEKTWGTAADYYYLTIEQTVDGIPIQSELIGNINNGTQTWGSEGSAVLSEEGLGYLRVFSPYKIVGEVETTEKFIILSEAWQMFNDKIDSFLTTEDITVNYSRLVYVVLRNEDNSLTLTPAWEFKYNDELFFRVNAYTGEEIVTV